MDRACACGRMYRQTVASQSPVLERRSCIDDVVILSRKVDLTRLPMLFVVLSICGAPLYTFVLFLPSFHCTQYIALTVERQHALA